MGRRIEVRTGGQRLHGTDAVRRSMRMEQAEHEEADAGQMGMLWPDCNAAGEVEVDNGPERSRKSSFPIGVIDGLSSTSLRCIWLILLTRMGGRAV